MICISLIFLVNIIIKSADCEKVCVPYTCMDGRYNIQVGVIFEVNRNVLNSDKVKIEKKYKEKGCIHCGSIRNKRTKMLV